MNDLGALHLQNLEMTDRGPLVLLFYDGYERRAREGLQGALHSQAHRAARYLYRSARRKQVRTGFYTAFLSLQASLKAAGCDVRVNDFAAARKRPNYPIGLAGYPSALSAVPLPNQVIFGHGDIGLPEEAAKVAQRENMRILIQPCDWACAFNRQACGDKLRAFPVGVDISNWNWAPRDKTIDFVIYDKIRWHRETQVPAVLDRITSSLDRAGLTYRVLRYGGHIQKDYRAALAEARALLFVCEHETQGIAYQEAMAAGIPVLAWDEGELVDPNLRRYAPDLRVSSVPYFDARCGETFAIAGFDQALGTFMARRETYDPKSYMDERLSLQRAAADYLAMYASLGG